MKKLKLKEGVREKFLFNLRLVMFQAIIQIFLKCKKTLSVKRKK
jgi:hypothetical protein